MTTQNPAKRPRALIAMSGGVDSSVAACLMQQAGYDCTGITMRLTHNETLVRLPDLLLGKGYRGRR
jgi:tRNA-specific 2-thiouridylase